MKCPKCSLSFIDEERNTHECRKGKGFHIKGDVLWLSDGVTEYPLKLDRIKNDIQNGKISLYQPTGNSDKNNRRGNRAIIRQIYK